MKKTVKFLSLVIIMVLFSCSSEPIIESETSLQSVASKAAANKSTVFVEERPGGFPDGDWFEIEGASSTIHRNKNGITVNFNTNGLIPGNAYTMWIVVFGTPGTPPGGPPTQSSYGAGYIVGGSGNGNFSGHLNTGPGFNNPLTAEIHVVIRSHGQAVPGMIPDQIHTFEGGCDPDFTFPEGPGRIWADSDQVGYCANVQLAIHLKK